MSTAWGIPPRSAQRLQHHLADGLERVEHAVAADRDGFVVPRAADPLPARVLDEELPLVRGIRGDLLLRGFLDGPAGIERRLEVLDRRRVGQIALVVLDDERDLRQVVPVFGHVVVEVLHGFDVGFHALHLAVGDEYDAVHALEDELAARVVIHLARHGVEVEAGLEAADRPQVHREEVEEQGALGLGGQRDHLAPGVGRHLAVDVLQVRRLAAQAGAVIDELAVDLAGRVVNHRHRSREINCKLVYYGPGLGGKTTNLEHVYGKVSPNTRGKMISLATETERTLFFDFLPVDLGTIRGFKTRFHLYTVPGQVYYNASRKLILKGVDGIVFVADSQIERMEANVESMQNLHDNMAEYRYHLTTIPFVIQYNKRDLPNAAPIRDLQASLNPGWPIDDAAQQKVTPDPAHQGEFLVENASGQWVGRAGYYEAVAVRGDGVFDTLKAVSKMVLKTLS